MELLNVRQRLKAPVCCWGKSTFTHSANPQRDVWPALRRQSTPGWRPVWPGTCGQYAGEGEEAPCDFWESRERLTLRGSTCEARTPCSPLHASDLVSISLSFQTATFHYPPSPPPFTSRSNCPSPPTYSLPDFPPLSSSLRPSTPPLPSLPFSLPRQPPRPLHTLGREPLG